MKSMKPLKKLRSTGPASPIVKPVSTNPSDRASRETMAKLGSLPKIGKIATIPKINAKPTTGEKSKSTKRPRAGM